MRGLWERFLDLLYPPKCVFCRKPVTHSRMLCPRCEKKWKRRDGVTVQKEIPHLALCFSPLYYTGAVQKSLQRYKFHGAAAYYRIYAELMAECLQGQKDGWDRVTWVPLSRQRERTRGYDQAKLLAAEVARLLGLPCEKLLIKTKNNRSQSGTKSARERVENVKGVYRCTGVTAGEKILLIDDIVTTGATLASAAGELKAAGAGPITGLTVAATPLGGQTSSNWNGDSGNADF